MAAPPGLGGPGWFGTGGDSAAVAFTPAGPITPKSEPPEPRKLCAVTIHDQNGKAVGRAFVGVELASPPGPGTYSFEGSWLGAEATAVDRWAAQNLPLSSRGELRWVRIHVCSGIPQECTAPGDPHVNDADVARKLDPLRQQRQCETADRREVAGRGRRAPLTTIKRSLQTRINTRKGRQSFQHERQWRSRKTQPRSASSSNALRQSLNTEEGRATAQQSGPLKKNGGGERAQPRTTFGQGFVRSGADQKPRERQLRRSRTPRKQVPSQTTGGSTPSLSRSPKKTGSPRVAQRHAPHHGRENGGGELPERRARRESPKEKAEAESQNRHRHRQRA